MSKDYWNPSSPPTDDDTATVHTDNEHHYQPPTIINLWSGIIILLLLATIVYLWFQIHSIPNIPPTQTSEAVTESHPDTIDIPQLPDFEEPFDFYQTMAQVALNPTEQPLPLKPPAAYVVQAGAFFRQKSAAKELKRLQQLLPDLPLSISKKTGDKTYYLIRTQPLVDKNVLNRMRNQLRRNGANAAVIKIPYNTLNEQQKHLLFTQWQTQQKATTENNNDPSSKTPNRSESSATQTTAQTPVTHNIHQPHYFLLGKFKDHNNLTPFTTALMQLGIAQIQLRPYQGHTLLMIGPYQGDTSVEMQQLLNQNGWRYQHLGTDQLLSLTQPHATSP